MATEFQRSFNLFKLTTRSALQFQK